MRIPPTMPRIHSKLENPIGQARDRRRLPRTPADSCSPTSAAASPASSATPASTARRSASSSTPPSTACRAPRRCGASPRRAASPPTGCSASRTPPRAARSSPPRCRSNRPRRPEGGSPIDQWRREAAGMKLRYVPSNLPDMLRLEDDRGDSPASAGQPENVLGGYVLGDMDLEIAMPVQTLQRPRAGLRPLARHARRPAPPPARPHGRHLRRGLPDAAPPPLRRPRSASPPPSPSSAASAPRSTSARPTSSSPPPTRSPP